MNLLLFWKLAKIELKIACMYKKSCIQARDEAKITVVILLQKIYCVTKFVHFCSVWFPQILLIELTVIGMNIVNVISK